MLTADIEFLESHAFHHEMAFSLNNNKSTFKVNAFNGERLMGNRQAKEQLQMNLSLSYDPNEIPYYPQVMQVGLRNLSTGEVEYGNELYVYFTPWNTVEIWNETDFRQLPRAWEASNGNSRRKKIDRSSVTVSDLSSEEWLDNNVPKRYISVPGLAYTIPFKTNQHSSNRVIHDYSGIVNGILAATVTQPLDPSGQVDIALSGILVEAYSMDPFGDNMIGDTYTEDDGSFSIVFFENTGVRGNDLR